MAFDNLQFRSCSNNYNHNGFTDVPNDISVDTKDIGNGSSADNCLKFDLSKLNTVWNDDVTISAQVEVYFQAVNLANSAGTTQTTTFLGTVPVEQRQGLFRLPRYYAPDETDTKTVYKAEKDSNGDAFLWVDTTIVKGLHKTTKTDGSLILGYSPVSGDTEATAVTTIYFPEPTITDEFTIKRLTHSITDFVTYQAGGQLTSNLLNFQKGQEMYLLQELLWTIEMDMVTFTDLSGMGSIVTSTNDGTIDPAIIDLSLYQLNNTVSSEGETNKVVLYKPEVGATWDEQATNALINVNDVIDVVINTSGTAGEGSGVALAAGHGIFWNDTLDKWVNNTPDGAASSCSATLASTLTFCSGAHTSTAITDVFITGDAFSTSDTILMTAGGLTTVPIATLSDVVISTPASNHVLAWDGTSAWKNVTIGSLTSGILGPAGGDTFKFDYDNDAVSPTSGELIFLQSDGTTAATAYSNTAYIRVSTTDADTLSIANWLEGLSDSDSTVKGKIKVFKNGTPTVFCVFNLIEVTDSGSTRTLEVTPVGTSGTFLTDADEVSLTFSRTGDEGDQGVAGADGANGTNGTQGLQGMHIVDTVTAVISGDNIVFTFPRYDPAGTSPTSLTATLEDFNDVADTQILYIQSVAVDGASWGRYKYTLNTLAGGGGDSFVGINLIERENSGSASSPRDFNGITFAAPSGYADRTHGVHSTTNDTYILLPVGDASNKTGVFCKTVSGSTPDSTAYTKVFSVQNILNVVACG